MIPPIEERLATLILARLGKDFRNLTDTEHYMWLQLCEEVYNISVQDYCEGFDPPGGDA